MKMKIGKVVSLVVIAVTITVLVIGCRDEGEKPQEKSAAAKVVVAADRLVSLEKDVARLRSEVQQLRHRIERDAKMFSHAGMQRLPYGSDQPGRDVGRPEDLRRGGFRSRRSAMRNDPAMRMDPAKMTPEQRRAWHEERRRMREERMRQKEISESGKQTNPKTEKGENE